jgi:hypothetical protein
MYTPRLEAVSEWLTVWKPHLKRLAVKLTRTNVAMLGGKSRVRVMERISVANAFPASARFGNRRRNPS